MTQPTVVPSLGHLIPPRNRLYLMFRHPELRPPIFEEMRKDIEHVIRSQAKLHSDPSCPMLHEDELVQEGWKKFSQLLTKGMIEKLPRNDNPSRQDFFSFFRCSVNNYFMGMVHRYRGTQKRTGKKIPKRIDAEEVLTFIEDFLSIQKVEGRLPEDKELIVFKEKRKKGESDDEVAPEGKKSKSSIECRYRPAEFVDRDEWTDEEEATALAFYICRNKIRRVDLAPFGFKVEEYVDPSTHTRRFRYSAEDLEDMGILCDRIESKVEDNSDYQEAIDKVLGMIADAESNKPSEVSLDDEEAREQVDSTDNFYSDAGGMRKGNRPVVPEESQVLLDLKESLNPLQRLILENFNSPNAETGFMALLDSWRGYKPGSTVKIDFGPEHYAAGLGIDVETYKANFAIIQEKARAYTMDKIDLAPEELTFAANVRKLSDHFQVQIPRSFVQNDKDCVRRCLTIAARLNNGRVTEEIAALLRSVGAKAPESCNAQLSCYGVLYDKTEAICQRCCLNNNCAAEAINGGLTVRLSPKLLGAKGTRVASFLPNSAMAHVIPDGDDQPNIEPQPVTPVTNSERDDAVLSHLMGNYGKTQCKPPCCYFRHKERLSNGKIKYIFYFDPNGSGPIRLRFCVPSDELDKQLMKIKNGSYLPDNVTAEKAIELIDRHAQETFE